MRRFLPSSERKKVLKLDTSDRLIYLLMCLMSDLSASGQYTDMSGLMQHITFMSEMSATGLYKVEALCSYDEHVRDRARQHGFEMFGYFDTVLIHRLLGFGAMRWVDRGAPGGGTRSGANRSGANKSSGGNKKRGFVGWKKTAADKGICFEFSLNRPCSGCDFRHSCVYCDSTSHGCTSCSAKAGDNTG